MLRKVIIIDDEMSQLLSLKFGLKKIAKEILSFDNPAEALKELKKYTEKNDLDLVITDYMMPQMRGTEISSFMQKSKILKNIPVILYSGAQDLMPDDLKDFGILAQCCKIEGISGIINKLAEINIIDNSSFKAS